MEGTENGADGSRVRYFPLLWTKFYRNGSNSDDNVPCGYNVATGVSRASQDAVDGAIIDIIDGVDALHLTRNFKVASSYGERDA